MPVLPQHADMFLRDKQGRVSFNLYRDARSSSTIVPVMLACRGDCVSISTEMPVLPQPQPDTRRGCHTEGFNLYRDARSSSTSPWWEWGHGLRPVSISTEMPVLPQPGGTARGLLYRESFNLYRDARSSSTQPTHIMQHCSD